MKPLHSWDLTPSAAVALQRELVRRVRTDDDFGLVKTIAGVDVSTTRDSDRGYAAVVVMSVPDLKIIEVARAELTLTMPYVPGLLSFREVPLVLAAWSQLHTLPDLVFVDGHGQAHPRRLGIACHLGLWIDRPTIGCGKTILVGDHAALEPTRGSRQPLIHRGEVVGWALRTKDRVNPMYVSGGHRVSNETAVRWVLECGRGYRLPEPTRQAHLAANDLRRLSVSEV